MLPLMCSWLACLEGMVIPSPPVLVGNANKARSRSLGGGFPVSAGIRLVSGGPLGVSGVSGNHSKLALKVRLELTGPFYIHLVHARMRSGSNLPRTTR